MLPGKRNDIVAELQSQILRLQGFKSLDCQLIDTGLGAINDAFPNSSFPMAAVHEFLTSCQEDVAATGGFVAGLLSSLMGSNGTALWINSSTLLFPPALTSFGIQPDHLIFMNLEKDEEILWAMDEALKCSSLSAVVAEVKELTFNNSRRLQLAVEKSKVTGFVIRRNSKRMNTTACVSRWKIISLPGEVEDDLPGIGFPGWRVELLRIRNGRPGTWDLIWSNGRFQHLLRTTSISIHSGDRQMFVQKEKKAG